MGMSFWWNFLKHYKFWLNWPNWTWLVSNLPCDVNKFCWEVGKKGVLKISIQDIWYLIVQNSLQDFYIYIDVLVQERRISIAKLTHWSYIFLALTHRYILKQWRPDRVPDGMHKLCVILLSQQLLPFSSGLSPLWSHVWRRGADLKWQSKPRHCSLRILWGGHMSMG